MYRVLAAVLVLFVSSVVWADDDDLQLWSETEVEHKYNDKWAVSTEGLIRFDEDISRMFAAMPEINLKYKLNTKLQFIGTYRLVNKKKEDGWKQGHRGNIDVKIKEKVGPVGVGYTFRYQDLYMQKKRTTMVRNRVELSPRIRPWIYASAETFHKVNGNPGFNKLRLDFGRSFPLPVTRNLTIFYRTEVFRRPGVPQPHIIGIKTGLDL